VIIIHGENTKASYARLNALVEEYKSKELEVHSFDASEMDLTRLEQELNPSDLFGNRSILVITDLFTGTKSKLKESLKKSLQLKLDQPIVIYEQKEVTAAGLKPFAKATIEVFKISPQIFKFLEALSPGSSSISQYNSLLQQDTEPEFIFAMLTRQIRLLITAKTDPTRLKTVPFVKKLLQQQASKFSLDQLLNLHHRLYLIDRQIKLGETPLGMEPLLTGFLTSL